MTGREVRRLRRAARVSQLRLAAAVGVDNSLISRIESGERPLSEERAQQLRQAILRLRVARQRVDGVWSEAVKEVRAEVRSVAV